MAHIYLLAIIFCLQIFLLVTVPFFLLRALVQILSDRTDVPFVKTAPALFPLIADALEIAPHDHLYDLGCGDGSFLLWCAKRYPSARFTGIDLNPLLVRYARYRARRAGVTNVEFRRENIFDVDLTEATKIYAYLLHRVMDRLLPKMEEEFDGRLASRAFRFKAKQPTRTLPLLTRAGSYGQHLLHIYEF